MIIVVHGGAGSEPTPERAERRQRGIDAALDAGMTVLRDGGSALDAVCAAVVVLEDDPSFNAGRGGVATAAGTHELDASVMRGADRRAGAVAAITGVKNPVLAARAVLDDGRHVLFAGDVPFDLEPAPPGWFDVASDPGSSGTVGAVALDEGGHVAAATSTGGRGGQLPGRVGDSPIIGAGTWADDTTCAVSGTGAGELFIRAALAHTVHALVASGASLADACAAALADVASLGGSGGCIAITPAGDVAAPHSTPSMAWGIRRHG
jgi:isoaspartyl peptidase/L-asparaginase-like protein (Ntn-hydrolase superfamily)